VATALKDVLRAGAEWTAAQVGQHRDALDASLFAGELYEARKTAIKTVINWQLICQHFVNCNVAMDLERASRPDH